MNIARYTVEDVQNVFGVSYTPEQRAALENVPFSEAVLKECEGTHMLFPGFPLTLLEIREKFAKYFYYTADCWYTKEAFATKVRLSPSWYLLRKEPVPDSFRKTWGEQQTLLQPNEDVPSAVVVVFATMLHFKLSDERLFERSYVRMSDGGADGSRVFVGAFDAGGVGVNAYWDGSRRDFLGVSSVRKF